MAVKTKPSAGKTGKAPVTAPAKAVPVKATPAKAEAKEKKFGICLVTGQPTGSPNSHFRPGMDARLKGQLIKVMRGEASISTISKAALKVMRENGEKGLVGFRINDDGELEHFGKFSIAEKKAKKEKSAPAPAKVKKAAAAKSKAANLKNALPDEDEEEEEEEVEEDEDEE